MITCSLFVCWAISGSFVPSYSTYLPPPLHRSASVHLLARRQVRGVAGHNPIHQGHGLAASEIIYASKHRCSNSQISTEDAWRRCAVPPCVKAEVWCVESLYLPATPLPSFAHHHLS